MDSTSVKSLLQEAETLGIYAARNGSLPEDSRIFEVTNSIRSALERGEHPGLSPLIAEIAKVSSAAGLTIKQLLRRETPMGQFRQWAAQMTPFLLGFVTLLLTLYLTFQSSQLHKADLALRENQDLVSERPQEKIYLAWKMYKYESVLNVKELPLAQLDNYQKLVDDAKRLYVKRTAVQFLLTDASVIRYVPEWLENVGPEWFRNLAKNLNSPGSVTDPLAFPTNEPLSVNGIISINTDEKGLQEAKLTPIDCAERPALPVKNAKTATLNNKSDIDQYVQSFACFMQSLQIVDDGYPTDPSIYATRNKVHLLVAWLLPGLYGLLGACVFVMRDLLRNHESIKVGGDARIVDLLTLLLRVALGGLAGIIIGWFSVPTSPITSSVAVNISSIPFGLAFLAGFSIESLFTLLDRLNKTIGQQDEKKKKQ